MFEAPTISLLGLGADFLPAYTGYIKPAEGWYVNNPSDRGGETYGGIARKFFPDEPIWAIIDSKKWLYADGVIPINTHFPELDGMVQDFYDRLWVSGHYGDINSQILASLVFDTRVLHGATGVKLVQQLVGATQDGIMGPKTAAAINAYPIPQGFKTKLFQPGKTW